MHDYSRPLGDAVKRARGKLDLTQNEVADLADVDVSLPGNADLGLMNSLYMDWIRTGF